MSRLRVGAPVLAAWVAALLSGGLPAHAQAQVGAVCTIEGSATAEVQWAGGSGPYVFGPTGLGFTCVGGGESGGSLHTGTASVATGSTGHFTNIECGTGSAADGTPSPPTVAGTDADLVNRLKSTDFSYNISFLAGHGALTWSDLGGTDDDSFSPRPRTTSTATAPVGGGDIEIWPWDPITHPGAAYYFPLGSTGTPGTGFCTQGFTAHGVVTLALDAGSVPPPPTSGPVNVVPPQVSGRAQDGQTLTTDNGTWAGNPNPTSFTYQWQRCPVVGFPLSCTAVGSSSSYTLTSSDVGSLIRVGVTAYNGTSSSADSLPTGPVQAAGGGSSGTPSDTCKTQGSTAAKGDDEQLLGLGRVLVFVWPISTTKVDLCVRGQAASAGDGALIEVDGGSAGVSPVVDPNQPYDSVKCPQQIHHSDLLGDDVYVSNPGVNPASICIRAAGTSKRVDVGTTGSSSPPLVCWTLDSAPANRTCKP